MKRKIIVALSVFTLVFLLAGVDIARRIDAATTDLNHLITLHQVEILREQYLLHLKQVELDFLLRSTQGSRNLDVVIADVDALGKRVDSCFACHHSAAVTEQLNALNAQTELYKGALQRSMARAPGLASVDDPAFPIGEKLIGQVRDIVDVTTVSLERQTRRTAEAIRHAQRVLYALLAVGPVLAALLGYLCISGLTRQLRVLLASTRKLKGGDLDHRVARLSDEFQELAEAFNDMAGSLKEHMLRTQRTEQMVVVGQLAAGLAHEIKNPLGGIKAAMQVLADEAELSKEDRDLVGGVSREVARLESLMKNFLNFAKPGKPQLTELDVNALIDMILAFHVKTHGGASSGAAPVTITRDLQPVPELRADPMQLQQVLLNLVLNAVDAMPEGGTLSVRTSATGSAIQIEISDTGRGISPEHVEKIFLPFFTTKPKGTGLGLAICKQLVEQHGGAISVAPNPAGGSIFRVQLPSPAPTPVAA
ncbi:HAMP domain-containing sensor histidine kinase [Anaeromyxobacter paludicola]|uniref:histidine kinase n=1 Tax=Anaeromyxobacter paludicola TaxID=2918171 RepID=A0ABM7XDW8_9BACT|nr:HAMP domain-containing sensor histidine kinase [Anaeromyxobacter paludicola]BDG10060.1 hypothetical protein AMPC_31730 [Anaeromyxobacter paludicola]